MGEETLFRSAVRRLSGETTDFRFDAPLILTSADFRFIVMEQLGLEDSTPKAVLIEPALRNTGPALLAAALYLAKQSPDALMLVAPSDHVIPNTAAFHAAVAQGLKALEKGDMVTFGIEPTHAETGYGYLQLTEKPNGSGEPISLSRFVEKPDADRAAEMVASGDYLWNAGIFLFSVKALIAAFEDHAPDIVEPVRRAVEEAQNDLDFLRLAPEAWNEVQDISIDYAIMERAPNLSVVPYGGGWSDLGDWDAVWRHSNADENGVVLSGAATAINCRNSLLRSENEGLELVGLGLDNIIAIAMNDAVLVANKDHAQDVKLVVETLKEKNVA